MLYYKMGKEIKYLPLGEIFENKFSKYIKNNVISLAEIEDLKEYYYYTDLLFGYICNIFTIIEQDNEAESLQNEKMEILSSIETTDRLQKFLYRKGKVQQSINYMNQFIYRILQFYEKENELDKIKKEV